MRIKCVWLVFHLDVVLRASQHVMTSVSFCSNLANSAQARLLSAPVPFCCLWFHAAAYLCSVDPEGLFTHYSTFELEM